MKNILLCSLLAGLAAPVAAQTPFITPVPAPDPAQEANAAVLHAAGRTNERPGWASYRLLGQSNAVLYRYQYDAGGRVLSVIVDDSLRVPLRRYSYMYTYNALGQLAQADYNGWTTGQNQTSTIEYFYNAYGHVTAVRGLPNPASGQTTSDKEYDYTYHPTGAITSMTEYVKYPNQPRQPLFRLTFTVLNGQWQSCVQERYVASAWQRVRVDHRFNWRNWPARELAGNRWTDYSGSSPAEVRDTLVYRSSAAGTVVSITSQARQPNGSWVDGLRAVRRYDAIGHRTSLRNYVGSLLYQQDSSTFRYWYGRLERQLDYAASGAAPGTLRPAAVTYYGGYTFVTSTAAPRAAAAFILSPNPSSQWLSLQLAAPTAPGPVQAEVLNGLGQVVHRARWAAGAGAPRWDVSGWPAGLYTVRLQAGGGSSSQRFVKQ
jgi:hypothetical protein